MTAPGGGIIQRSEYDTLVNYALDNDIRKFDIVWTSKQPIVDSIVVLNESTTNFVMAGGAFCVSTGKDFYDNNEAFFEADDEYTFDDKRGIQQMPYVLWRRVDDNYLEQYPDHELWWFEVDGQVQDIFFFIWPSGIEEFPQFALIPK